MNKKPNLRRYGDNGTIHHTNHIDIETDTNGDVIAVWFRCQPLLFVQTKHNRFSNNRVTEMKEMYKRNNISKLHAVIVED